MAMLYRYDSSFPSVEESLAVKHTGDSTVVNEQGKEEILMRVVVVGGGEEEGKFVKNLSEKGAGTLVDGLYVLWDPRWVRAGGGRVAGCWLGAEQRRCICWVGGGGASRVH